MHRQGRTTEARDLFEKLLARRSRAGLLSEDVALESGDLNTAGVAMFKIKPKTEGVRLYWAEDLPAGMTLAEAEAHNVGALLESDGVVVDNAKVTCTYKKKGLFSSKSTEFPTQPGIYTQTATVSGNYSCEKITRTIVIN